MAEKGTERTCITCGAKLMAVPKSTSFPCPKCGKIIGRCGRCRKLFRKYKHECGFEGP